MTLSIHGTTSPVGTGDLPLDLVDPDTVEFVGTADPLRRAPLRRWGIRGHGPASTPTAGPSRGRRSAAARPGRTAAAALARIRGRSSRTVECRNCAETRSNVPSGNAVGQVVLDELDAVGDPARTRSLCGATECGLGDVDRDDVPAPLGEPHRVGALTAAEIERPSGWQICGHLGEADVDPTTPDSFAFSVVLFPVRLCVVHAASLPRRSSICQSYLPCRQRQSPRTTSTCGFDGGCGTCACSAA